MEIDNCIVVIKQTELSKGGMVARLAHKGDATARRLVRAADEHHRTIDAARKSLNSHWIKFTEISIDRLGAAIKKRLGAADLIITIGGDGTALGTSHYVRSGAMLCVNSAPDDSVGHYCSLSRKTFAKGFEAILSGEWKPVELARLQIRFDGKLLPELALNDVLIAHSCPASTTRYLIKIGRREEEHRSSGIWISTAAGSTAGIRSAGGRVLPQRSRRIQYLVRELYRERNRRYEMVRGFVDPDAEITIASKMPEGYLYIDGARTRYNFPFGTRAQIGLAESSLRIYR